MFLDKRDFGLAKSYRSQHLQPVVLRQQNESRFNFAFNQVPHRVTIGAGGRWWIPDTFLSTRLEGALRNMFFTAAISASKFLEMTSNTISDHSMIENG